MSEKSLSRNSDYILKGPVSRSKFLCVCVCVCVCVILSLCRVQLFETPWTVACQASLSMEFSLQECWSGLPFPPPGDLPDPGFKPTSPASLALAGRFFNH